MSESYTKLMSSIVQSTVWSESLATKVVWITMLALADRKGYVGASIPGLAKTAGVTIEECEEALRRFHSPDPYSRTKEHEGRRVSTVERGWFILNYDRIRGMMDSETVKESKRLWWKKHRGRVAQETRTELDTTRTELDTTRTNSTDSTQAEAEAEAVKTLTPTVSVPETVPVKIGRSRAEAMKGFDGFYATYPRKVGKVAAGRAWLKLCPDGELQAKMAAALDQQRESEQWKRDGGAFIPHLSTWLNGRRWEDEPEHVLQQRVFGRCHYCTLPAVNITGSISHCYTHLDEAKRGRT